MIPRIRLRPLLAVLVLAGFPNAAPPVAALEPQEPGPTTSVGAADAVVRAVLFYSPRCPHCHEVMRSDLPPLMERHGDALSIVAVNVDSPEGQTLYQAVVDHLALPNSRKGVPALLVGETLLVGSAEIPARLPGLVDDGLSAGGIGWPPIPGVRSYLALEGIAEEATVEIEPWMLGGGGSSGSAPAAWVLGRDGGPASDSARDRFMRDPVGNGLAVAVLLGMLGLLVYSARRVARPRGPLPRWPAWAIPMLAVMGMGIAGYLSYVEVSGAAAVCGPVGDCNRVQQSPWASIAGVPVGFLGLAGYLVLGAVALARATRVGGRSALAITLWGMAAIGVTFSIYLTFLEPFVIGATCLWCINSAVVMTLILLLATPDAARARLAAQGDSAGARDRG